MTDVRLTLEISPASIRTLEQLLERHRGGARSSELPAPSGVAELLTERQVLALLQVARSTLQRLVRHGHLPRVELPGSRVVRYRLADVEALVAAAPRLEEEEQRQEQRHAS